MTPSDTRDRLGEGAFLTPCANNPGGRINAALPKVIAAEPVERKFLKAVKAGQIDALEVDAQLQQAQLKGILSASEVQMLKELHEITLDAISVDDFDSSELVAASFAQPPAARGQTA